MYTLANSDACPRPTTGGASEGGLFRTTVQPPYDLLKLRAYAPRQVDALRRQHSRAAAQEEEPTEVRLHALHLHVPRSTFHVRVSD
jgi:hypothetical protein